MTSLPSERAADYRQMMFNSILSMFGLLFAWRIYGPLSSPLFFFLAKVTMME